MQNDAFYAMDYNLNFKIESAQLVNDGESAEEAVNAQSWAVKKAKQYAINEAVIDDYTGISLDEEYPPEVWGFQD